MDTYKRIRSPAMTIGRTHVQNCRAGLFQWIYSWDWWINGHDLTRRESSSRGLTNQSSSGREKTNSRADNHISALKQFCYYGVSLWVEGNGEGMLIQNVPTLRSAKLRSNYKMMTFRSIFDQFLAAFWTHRWHEHLYAMASTSLSIGYHNKLRTLTENHCLWNFKKVLFVTRCFIPCLCGFLCHESWP